MICVGTGDHVKRAWRSGALYVMTKSLLIRAGEEKLLENQGDSTPILKMF